MKNIKLISLSSFGLVAAIALSLAGCSSSSEPAANSSATTAASTTPDPKPAAKPEGDMKATPVAFTNDKGELLCPVNGDVVASPDKAAGFQDYEGKRYYFCCAGCPDKFKADPAKYADGKALKKL